MALKPINTKPLELSYEGGQLFLKGQKVEGSVRTIGEMRAVLHDEGFVEETDQSVVLYYMYRNLAPELAKHGLRFDITIIPHFHLGMEHVKTYGHYHPYAEGTMSYPEVYEVYEGEAHYLLQKKAEGVIADVRLVKAKKGDVVIVPPNYGHVTINPSDETLVMGNVVARGFDSLYEEYEARGGAAYFELLGGELVKNKHYHVLPEIKVESAGKTQIPSNIVKVALEKPALLEFLKKPSLFKG